MGALRILIVDDDTKILRFLRLNLGSEGWKILTAKNGAEALQIAENESPDLILLDMMLPVIDGFEVCRQLRIVSNIPIIGLSARGEMSDKVSCLNLGADDYITKPFELDELIARIKAVLRRNKLAEGTPQINFFSIGDIQIDFITQRVIRQGVEVKLTPTEYNLLRELVINAGNPLTHAYLLIKIWGKDYSAEREYLHVYIGHLRNKLENDPKNPGLILSIPGVGYIFKGSDSIRK